MAGALLAERVRRGAEREVTSKSTPTDLVSEADLAAERAIRELLAERRPDDGFVGEEGEQRRGHAAASAGSWTRSTAPSTSSSGYRSGASAWPCATSRARSRARSTTPTATSCSPPRATGGPRWSGPADSARAARPSAARSAQGHGGGARRRRRAGRRSGDLATRDGRDRARLRRERARRAGAVLARLVPRVRDIRRFGSAALDLAWTAAGRYDAYFERTVKQWDIAAGALICERAGLACSSCPCTRTCRGGSSWRRPRSPSSCSSWSGGP